MDGLASRFSNSPKVLAIPAHKVIPLYLPDKTAYTLTYKASNLAQVWQGAVHLHTTRRMLILVVSVCLIVALAIAFTGSLTAFSSTFFCSLICVAFFQFLLCLCGILFHTVSVVLLSKLNVEYTTIVDEYGVSDTLGPVKFKYQWHQIRDIEMKKGSIYVIGLINGIHIPACAFASSSQAEEVFALAQRYKEAAHRIGNLTSGDADTCVQDPDILLKSLHEEEEAQWREIENRHKEKNRE